MTTGGLDSVALRTRLAFNVAMRHGTRVNQLISPFWTDRSGWRRLMPLGGLVADTAIVRRLLYDDRLRLLPRLAFDAAELAFASATALRDDYDEASVPMIPGCPLAIETGVRHGALGMVVPLVNGVVATVVRRRRGMTPRTALVGWQVAAAGAGAGLAAYGRRRRGAELERHRRELEAQIGRAEIAGRSDVANGVDAVLDEVQRATTLVQLSVGDSVNNVAGAWKADLGGEIRRDYAFFGDVISQWQASVNAGFDLRNIVHVTIDEQMGTALLTRSQAEKLRAALDQMNGDSDALRGRIEAMIETDRTGAVVRVAEREIKLPFASRDVALTFDPVPAGFGWSAVWLAVAGVRSREAVPRWASLGPAALALGGAVWAHRSGTRTDVPNAGRVVRRDAVRLSGALTISAAALQTKTMTNKWGAGGTSRFPFTLALRGFTLVALLSWRDLHTSQRAEAVGVGLATTAIGWVMSPRPRTVRELVAELVWPMQSLFAGSLAAAIDRDAAELSERLRADDVAQLDAARERGRRHAAEVARRSIEEAELDVRSATELPERLRIECERRLAVCRQRLTAPRTPADTRA